MRLAIGFLILLAIIIEATLLPFPFALLIIILISDIFAKEAVYWAFSAGLILDIFAFRTLGISSIFFLGLIWSAERFKKKFHQGWVYYQFFALTVIIVLYSIVIYRHIDIFKIVIALITGALTLFVLRNLIPVQNEQKKLFV